MSQQVDTIRALCDAFGRGDYQQAVQHLHPEIELRPAFQGPDTGRRYRGRDECQRFLESYRTWESQRVEFEETIEVGDRVLVVERWYVQGRDGLEFDFEVVDVYTFRDDLIREVAGFLKKDDALAAVGLE